MRNKLNYIYLSVIALALVVMLPSCGNDFDFDEQNGDVQELAGYVAFNAPGNSATLDPSDVSEGETVTFNIENPTGTLSDITVNYTFAGSAVFGTDFTIDGASASGGSLVISHDPGDFNFFDNEDLEVTLLTDGVTDGDKTLEITLVSATNAEGDIAVGRGGTDFLKTALINITDIDCGSDLAGNYMATGTGFLDGYAGAVEIVQLEGNGNYAIDDFAGLAFGDPVAYEFSVACGVVSAPAVSDISGVAATITGAADESAKTINLDITLNCCGGEGLMWSLALSPQ